MSLYRHPGAYFQSGSPMTDEYLASYTFLNGTQFPYPGMKGQITEFDIGTGGARNIITVQLVKAASGVTPAKGALLYFTASGKGIYEVTTTYAAGSLAGVCPVLMTAAASAFWMIKKGDVPVLLVDAPTVAAAAGTAIVTSSTAGKGDSLANSPTQGAYQLVGVCMSTQDGTTKLATVRVNVPDTW